MAEKENKSSETSGIAPDRKALCEQWLTQTEEGKAFLRSKLPSEVFFYGEALPGNPMTPESKPKVTLHHELGFHLTKHEADAGLKHRTLVVIPVKRAE